MAVFQGSSQVERSSAEIRHEGLQVGNIWETGAERKWRLAVWVSALMSLRSTLKLLSALSKIQKRKFHLQVVQFPC